MGVRAAGTPNFSWKRGVGGPGAQRGAGREGWKDGEGFWRSLGDWEELGDWSGAGRMNSEWSWGPESVPGA